MSISARQPDELERATSPTMQSLRLHSLSGVLQILSHDVTDHALAEALDSISAATRSAIGDGSAASQHRRFAAILRAVGSKLRAVSESGGRTGLAEALATLAQDVRNMGLPRQRRDSVAVSPVARRLSPHPLSPRSPPKKTSSPSRPSPPTTKPPRTRKTPVSSRACSSTTGWSPRTGSMEPRSRS